VGLRQQLAHQVVGDGAVVDVGVVHDPGAQRGAVDVAQGDGGPHVVAEEGDGDDAADGEVAQYLQDAGVDAGPGRVAVGQHQGAVADVVLVAEPVLRADGDDVGLAAVDPGPQRARALPVL